MITFELQRGGFKRCTLDGQLGLAEGITSNGPNCGGTAEYHILVLYRGLFRGSVVADGHGVGAFASA
jgi:hypothetical protein